MIDFIKNQDAFKYKTQTELKRARFVFYVFKYRCIAYVLQHMLRLAIIIRIPVAWVLKKTVYGHFVGGESLSQTKEIVTRMSKFGVESILDYSVESGFSEKSIKSALNEIKRSIRYAAKSNDIPFAVFKPSALTYEWVLCRKNVKELTSEFEKFEMRMEELFSMAEELDVPILVDAEEVSWQDAIDQVTERGMQIHNRKKPIVFHTLQMYRIDRLSYLKTLIRDARKDKYYLGIKLVRGAYLEKERLIAKRNKMMSPVFSSKAETDDAFNSALKLCVDNIDILSVFNGTHNYRSCLILAQLMDAKQLEKTNKKLYFVQLYGMSDDLSFGLANESYRVAKYVPYGPIKQVMPYLMRRAKENTAVREQAKREYRLLLEELKRRKNTNYVD